MRAYEITEAAIDDLDWGSHRKPVTQVFDMDNAKFAEMIFNDCDQFISDIDGDLPHYQLFRGIEDSPDFGTKQVRKQGRTPLSTDGMTHSAMNEWFKSNYGLPWRNAAFCTGKRNDADVYGTVYNIFPKGNYKVLWHNKLADLYGTIGVTAKAQHKKHHTEEPWDAEAVGYALDDYNEPQNKMNFVEGNIKEAIQSWHEIMLWCDEYYYMTPAVFKKLLDGMQHL